MKKYAVFSRVFAIIFLIVAWASSEGKLSGVVLILTLVALTAVRYRIKPFRFLPLAEVLVCVVFAFVWEVWALSGLWLAVIGLLEDKFSERENELLKSEIKNRIELLKLEKLSETRELDLTAAKRMAELAERARIAQDVHDHAGHEISGALIALRTAVKLYEKAENENDIKSGKKAHELLIKAVSRLEKASENLREAVHNLKPAVIGENNEINETLNELSENTFSELIETLREICASFDFCEVEFSASGNLNNIGGANSLITCLKEALTNVSRHSNANLVKVDLTGNNDYIKLSVLDNGKPIKPKKAPFKLGLGLTGIKERAVSSGGTFSANFENKADGFKLAIIIPKGKM